MTARLIRGDVREVLATLDAESVQTVVTSPPYFGLRDYGVDGQIGLEPTPQAFVAALVDVFREVRRVLRPDGTVWLNLGDSYAGNGTNRNGIGNSAIGSGPDGACKYRDIAGSVQARVPDGLKPKDLIGIPWRVAFALQEDGWWLRSDIIWAKPNPMPESVTDRPTKGHEYIFLLTKQASYYYDAAAIAEPITDYGQRGTDSVYQQVPNGGDNGGLGNLARRIREARINGETMTRNKRSVWTVATQPYSEAHFATYPEKLIEPCILAGSREGDTVLDPFAGSGTTGVVALRHGRSFVGVELNPEYARLAERRITNDAPLFNVVEVAS